MGHKLEEYFMIVTTIISPFTELDNTICSVEFEEYPREVDIVKEMYRVKEFGFTPLQAKVEKFYRLK